MSKHNWKPGDLAVVTTRTGIEYRAVWRLAPGIDYFWSPLSDAPRTNQVTDPDVDARPLVVIDPEDDAETDRLRDLLRDHGAVLDGTNVYAALREFANPPPPKPKEPTGLGAVVEDAEGVHWVSWRSGLDVHERPWQRLEMDTDEFRDYADIAVVTTHFEGVPK